MPKSTWLFPPGILAAFAVLTFLGPTGQPTTRHALYPAETKPVSPDRWDPRLSVVQTGTAMVFPQVGDGPYGQRFFQTTIVLANNTAHATTGTLEFLSDSGGPLEMEIGGNRAAAFNFQIAAGTTRKFVTSGTGQLRVGWAHVHSLQPLAGMASFGIRDARGTIYTDVGVAPAEPGVEFTLFADMVGSTRTGLAVANPSDQPAVLHLKLLRANGTALRDQQIPLSAWGHRAAYLDELFDGVAGIDEFEGSVRITSESPFCGMTLRSTEDQLTSMPLVPPAPETVDWTRLAFPQIGDGSGAGLKIQTSVILINNTASPTSGKIEFLGSDGKPLALRVGSQQGTSFDVSLPPSGVKRLTTAGLGSVKTGWARAVVDQSIRGVALFSISDGAGKLASEVGVDSPWLRKSFRLIADSTGLLDTGIALANPEEREGTRVSVTVQLVNLQGSVVAAKQVQLGPQEHSAQFFTELFSDVPDIKEFEGTLRISSSEPLAPLCLRQAGVKLTSAPLLGAVNGFAPRTVITPTHNLKGHAPNFFVNLIQNSDDFALQSLRISSPHLEFSSTAMPPGTLIAFGYFPAGNETRTYELITTEEPPGGFLMQAFDGDENVVLGLGTFSALPTGGSLMSLEFTRKEPYSVLGGNVNLRFLFHENLLKAPADAGRLEFTAEFESVSISPDRDQRIRQRQQLAVNLQDEDPGRPALTGISPWFVQPGTTIRLAGNRFGAAPLLSVSDWDGRELLVRCLPDGQGQWRAILPSGTASGLLTVLDGTRRSNTYQVQILYAPVFALSRKAGENTLQISWQSASGQFPVSRFELSATRLGVDWNQLAPGLELGTGSLWLNDSLAIRCIVRSVGAKFALADILQANGDEVLAELQLREEAGALRCVMVPSQAPSAPFIAGSSQGYELILAGLPVTWPADGAVVQFGVTSISSPTGPGGDLAMLKAVQTGYYVVGTEGGQP